MLPIPFYFITRRWPNSWVRYIHIPIMFAGCLNWAPYVSLDPAHFDPIFPECTTDVSTELFIHVAGPHDGNTLQLLPETKIRGLVEQVSLVYLVEFFFLFSFFLFFFKC